MILKTQDLRKELYAMLRRRAITVFTIAAVLCTGLAATDWASALYILTGAEDTAIVLEEGTPKPDFSSKIVKLSSGKTGYEITLTAGLTVTINHHGETQTIRSKKETVSRLLDRMDIIPGPLDMIYVDLSDNSVEITVDSEVTYYERTVEEVAYDTVRRENPAMEIGQEQVIQEGVDGIRSSVYEVIWCNGTEMSRQFVEQLDTTAVDEIIEYGTAAPPQAEPDPVPPPNASISQVSSDENGGGTLTLDNGETLRFTSVKSMTATAYTAGHGGVGTRTATGTQARVGTVAVDKNVIPLGSRLYIVTNDGIVYGLSAAEDTGVRGSKVDLYFNTYQECINFGRRSCLVYILE